MVRARTGLGWLVLLLVVGFVGCGGEPERPRFVPRRADAGAGALWAVPGSFVGTEDAPIEGRLAVTDATGAEVAADRYLVVVPPLNGRLLLQGDGGFRYEPEADFAGQDRFWYGAVVGEVRTATAVVELTVTPVNDAPRTSALLGVAQAGVPVELAVPATDPDGDALVVEVSIPPVGAAVEVLSDRTSPVFRFTADQTTVGEVTFWWRAGDGKLWSPPTPATISVLDGAAPTVALQVVDGTRVGTRTVRVRFTYDADTTGLRVYGDVVTATAWFAPRSETSVTLTPGEGRKLLYAQARDAAGNLGTPATASVVYDGEGPRGRLSGPTYTASVTVALSLEYSDFSGVASMCLDGAFAGAPVCGAPTTATTVVLVGGDGAKTLSVTFEDTVGNIGGPYRHVVTLDTQAPSGGVTAAPSLVAQLPATTTLQLWWRDAAPVTGVRIDGDLVGAGWREATTRVTVVLTGGEGPKGLRVRYADAAGNVGAVHAVQVTVDTRGPAVRFVAGPPRVTDATVASFAWTATDPAGVETWCTLDGVGPVSCTSPWVVAVDQGDHTFTVTGVDGFGHVATEAVWSWTVTSAVRCAGTAIYESDFAGGAVTGWSLATPWGTTTATDAGAGWLLTDSPAGDYAPDLDVAAALAVTVAGGCVERERAVLVVRWAHRWDLAAGDRVALETATAATGPWLPRLQILGPTTVTTWTRAAAVVTGVAPGTTLWLRFRLVSDTDAGTVAGGWEIDGLSVETVAVTAPAWGLALGWQPSQAPVTVRTAAGLALVVGGQGGEVAVVTATTGQLDRRLLLSATPGFLGAGALAGTGGTEVVVATLPGSLAGWAVGAGGWTVATTGSATVPPRPALGRTGTGRDLWLAEPGAGRLRRLGWTGAGWQERWRSTLVVLGDPALADLDGDGRDEAIVAIGGLVPGLAAIDDDGGELWRSTNPAWLGVLSPPILADLGNDGVTEAIFVSGAGALVAVTASGNGAGTEAWSSSLVALGGPAAAAPSAFDLDGQGAWSICVALAAGGLACVDAQGRLQGVVAGAVPVATALAWRRGDVAQVVTTFGDGWTLGWEPRWRPVWGYRAGGVAGWAPILFDARGDGTPELGIASGDGWLERVPIGGPGATFLWSGERGGRDHRANAP